MRRSILLILGGTNNFFNTKAVGGCQIVERILWRLLADEMENDDKDNAEDYLKIAKDASKDFTDAFIKNPCKRVGK